MPDLYDMGFYANQRGGSRRSAEIIVPLVLAAFRPRSVCDVGCGVGTWLSVFIENGITDVLGLDGAYAKSAGLMISDGAFKSTDLSSQFSISRCFDLAMSLEVAEHLPEHSARLFIKSLTRLAPVIVFSAAVPNQGGTGHINEQWQDYWANLFAEHNYIPIDCIRPQIWNNPEVEWWYIQNVLVYCSADSLSKFPEVAALGAARQISVAHPRFVAGVLVHLDFTTAVKALPGLFLRGARGRLARWIRAIKP
jgi:SAM-dependent methyltransferase